MLRVGLGRGRRWRGGIVVPPMAADYTAATSSALDLILQSTDATLSGKTIELTGASYGVITLSNRALTAPLTIRGPSAAAMPVVQGLTLAGGNSNVICKRLDLFDAATPAPRALVAFTGNGFTTGLSLSGCRLRGNTTLSTTADYSAGLPNQTTAISREGLSYVRDLLVEDCELVDLYNGLKLGIHSGGYVRFLRNRLTRIYEDPIHVATTDLAATPAEVTIRGNRAIHPLGRGTDTGNPHCDWIQLANNSSAHWLNITVEGNELVVGGARGTPQILMRSASTWLFDGARVCGNLHIGQGTSHGISIEEARNCYVYGNTIACDDPADADNTTALSINIGVAQRAGRNYVGYNITEAVNVFGQAVETGNTRLGKGGATLPYTTAFAGPTFAPADHDDAVAKFAPKAAYASRGAVGRGYVNRATGEVDRTLEPSFVPLADKVDVATSTLVTSDIVPVMGGVAGRTISVSGLEYQVTSDAAGTVVVRAWGTAAGTIDPGQYLQVRKTSSASSGTAVSGSVMIGAETYVVNFITASALTFPKVLSNGAYAQKTGALAGIADGKQGTLFIRAGVGSLAVVNDIIRQASQRLYARMLTSGKLRIRGQSAAAATVLQFDFNTAVAADLAVHAFLCSWNLDGADPTSPNLQVFRDWTDDRTLAGLTFIDTAIDLDQATNWQIGWGSTGGNIATAHECVWFHPQQIDLTNPVNRTLFYKERIGADGSGPLGFAPLVYWTGNAADLNAGTGNKGTGGTFAAVGSFADA